MNPMMTWNAVIHVVNRKTSTFCLPNMHPHTHTVPACKHESLWLYVCVRVLVCLCAWMWVCRATHSMLQALLLVQGRECARDVASEQQQRKANISCTETSENVVGEHTKQSKASANSQLLHKPYMHTYTNHAM